MKLLQVTIAPTLAILEMISKGQMNAYFGGTIIILYILGVVAIIWIGAREVHYIVSEIGKTEKRVGRLSMTVINLVGIVALLLAYVIRTGSLEAIPQALLMVFMGACSIGSMAAVRYWT